MSWLCLERIEDIQPLDLQLGVADRAHVPPALRDILFPPEPYADPARDAPRCYALIDPIPFGDMSQLSEHPAARKRSLYTGNEETEFAEVLVGSNASQQLHWLADDIAVHDDSAFLDDVERVELDAFLEDGILRR